MEIKIDQGVVQKPKPTRLPGSKKEGLKHNKYFDPANIINPEIHKKAAKYNRRPTKVVKGGTPFAKREIKRGLRHIKEAAVLSAKTELLHKEEAGFLEAEGLERTYNFRQDQLKPLLSVSAAAKSFDIDLKNDLGPYRIDYTRDGKHLLIGGRKGHVASFDWRAGKISCELELKETIRAVKFFQNNLMFAVAQKKYTYIYEHTGAEVHCLKTHTDVTHLDFLPYHFLLTSYSSAGDLRYLDVSMGRSIRTIPTKAGPASAFTHNPQNAIVHVGDGSGTVNLWSPNTCKPLVKMLCHLGPIRDIAIDHTGKYMASTGMDGKLKVWDLRQYKAIDEYFTPGPAASLSFSQRGLLAVGFDKHINIWKDIAQTKQDNPYMNHRTTPYQVKELAFCPYEDVLGFGHTSGFSSIIIPGAGEPNFDSLEVNLYASKKHCREAMVQSLLNKVQPDTISLDANLIGSIAPSSSIPDDDDEEAKDKPRSYATKSNQNKYLRSQRQSELDTRKERAVKKQADLKTRAQKSKAADPRLPPKPKLVTPRSALDMFRPQPQ